MDQHYTEFLHRHQLPDSYLTVLNEHALPIAELLHDKALQIGRTLLVGLNGSQGSGKTTLADALVMLLQHKYQMKAVAVSIDDFYLTRAERQRLAQEIHPLLATRGVPGTHDLQLANTTLQALSRSQEKVIIPRFDKSTDDRAPMENWPAVEAPVDVVILEGWCVNAKPQSMLELIEPVNELEANEDPEGNWRHYVNTQLQLDYRNLFDRFDVKLMLKAPSFQCVFDWRLEQENKLRERVGNEGTGLMSAEAIQRFIQHYQRITEHNLEVLPELCDWVLLLDKYRRITGVRR